MFQDGFPISLRDDVSKVMQLIPNKTYNNVSIGTSEQIIKYSQNGAEIVIPYRIYFLEVPDKLLIKLSLQQKMILHCIYTRSCDGLFAKNIYVHYFVWSMLIGLSLIFLNYVMNM